MLLDEHARDGRFLLDAVDVAWRRLLRSVRIYVGAYVERPLFLYRGNRPSIDRETGEENFAPTFR